MKKIVILTILFFACSSYCKQISQQDLVEYLHFVQQQYSDPNLAYARVKGYFDAYYGYQYSEDAENLFVRAVKKMDQKLSPEQAIVLLNECYCKLTTVQDNSDLQVANPVLRALLRNDICAEENPTTDNFQQLEVNTVNENDIGLTMDAYGPGLHMNQYGQPVKLRPDFGYVPGEYLQIKENAYGPGVHMDQYGRPVREKPWP